MQFIKMNVFFITERCGNINGEIESLPVCSYLTKTYLMFSLVGDLIGWSYISLQW